MVKLNTYFYNHPLIKNLTKIITSIVRIVLVVLSVVVVFQVSDWIASWAMKNIFGVPYSSLDRERSAIYGLIKYYVPAIFFIIISLLLNRSRKGLEEIGLLIHFKWWHLIAIILVIPVYMCIAYFVMSIQHEIHTSLDYWSWHIGWGWHVMSQHGNDWGFIFYSVACAPVGEEIIFRGWLYGRLRKILPSKWMIPIAIIIASVCFAWIHLNFKAAIMAFCFSICICCLRELTGNIYGGIIIHSLWNLQTFFGLLVSLGSIFA